MYKYIIDLKQDHIAAKLYQQYIDLVELYFLESNLNFTKGFAAIKLPETLIPQLWVKVDDVFVKVFVLTLSNNKIRFLSSVNLASETSILLECNTSTITSLATVVFKTINKIPPKMLSLAEQFEKKHTDNKQQKQFTLHYSNGEIKLEKIS